MSAKIMISSQIQIMNKKIQSMVKKASSNGYDVAIIDRIQVWFDYPPFEASFLVLLAVGIPLSFLAASLSFYVIERPFLRMKSESWNAAWSRATRRLRPTAPGTG